jgi:hypothetical protein
MISIETMLRQELKDKIILIGLPLADPRGHEGEYFIRCSSHVFRDLTGSDGRQ